MRLSRRLSNRVRKLLPEWGESAIRDGVRGFGTATSRWRMVPDLVIVGAQRSGTTTLFRLLSDHPQVLRPTMSKGVAYFDLNYSRGFAWYRGHFPLRVTARLRSSGKRIITFESSGYYMFHPSAAKRIANDLPGVRVVAVLRDPVERAHSAHKHELRRNFETEPFEEAIKLEKSRLDGQAERLARDPSYRSFSHQHHAYLGRGEYADQIRRLVEEVGKDYVYVIDAQQFFDDPVEEFGRLCDWLGLDRSPLDSVDTWNATPQESMDPKLRAELEQHFAPHNAELLRVLGDIPSWRSPGSSWLSRMDLEDG